MSSHSSSLLTVCIHFTGSVFMIFTHSLPPFPETHKHSEGPEGWMGRWKRTSPSVSITQSKRKRFFSLVTQNATIPSTAQGLSWAQDGSEGRVQRIHSEGSAKQSWIGWPGQAPLPGRWDPIIRRTRTPPPGFHSSSVYHMALSSWAPLTDNERRQPVQLQAKHSTFYRPKHVSGKLTVSIQFCSAFKRPITIPFPRAPLSTAIAPSIPTEQNLVGLCFWIRRQWNLTEPL